MIPRFSPTVTLLETLAFQADLLSGKDDHPDAVLAFERAFCDYLGANSDGVFVSSGRMALWLILQALDYPPGSEIIVPAFTFFAIPAVIQLAGLTPVYVDISPDTYELSADTVQAAITARTRAVIPTHLFGRTCEMTPLTDICRSAGIDIIEDCAQSMGATIDGTKAGTLGAASYFTFGITKNFTTFGGGMAICRDAAVYERMQAAASQFERLPKGKLLKNAITGTAMRLATTRPVFSCTLAPILRVARRDRDDIVQRTFEEPVGAIDMACLERVKRTPTAAQARAGCRQLAVVNGKNTQRRQLGRALIERLAALECDGLPTLPLEGGDHIFVSFAILRTDRLSFAHALRRQGVDSATGYMSDCSSMPALGGKPGQCPTAAAVASTIIHLPLYPGLKDRDLDRIANAVHAVDVGD